MLATSIEPDNRQLTPTEEQINETRETEAESNPAILRMEDYRPTSTQAADASTEAHSLTPASASNEESNPVNHQAEVVLQLPEVVHESSEAHEPHADDKASNHRAGANRESVEEISRRVTAFLEQRPKRSAA